MGGALTEGNALELGREGMACGWREGLGEVSSRCMQALIREGGEGGRGRKCMPRYSRSRATGDMRGGWHTPRA